MVNDRLSEALQPINKNQQQQTNAKQRQRQQKLRYNNNTLMDINQSDNTGRLSNSNAAICGVYVDTACHTNTNTNTPMVCLSFPTTNNEKLHTSLHNNNTDNLLAQPKKISRAGKQHQPKQLLDCPIHLNLVRFRWGSSRCACVRVWLNAPTSLWQSPRGEIRCLSDAGVHFRWVVAGVALFGVSRPLCCLNASALKVVSVVG